LLAGMSAHSDAMTRSRISMSTAGRRAPARPGMERKDLLEANGAIFTVQGRALDAVASRNVKVLVVGNPANNQCLYRHEIRASLSRECFTPCCAWTTTARFRNWPADRQAGRFH